MSETFTVWVEARVPQGEALPWRMVEAAKQALELTYGSELFIDDIAASTTDGREWERVAIGDLEDIFADLGEVPRHLDFHWSMPDFERSGRSGLITGGAHGFEMPETVNAQMSSNSRIEVLESARRFAEALEAALRRFGMTNITVKTSKLSIYSLDRPKPRGEVRAPVATPVATQAPVIPKDEIPTMPVETPNWFIRKWREHAASIVIGTGVGLFVTVVGGLIVYALTKTS